MEENVDNFDFIKIKNFFPETDIVKRMQRQATA